MGSRRKSKKGMKTGKRRKRRTSNVKKGGAKPNECLFTSVLFSKGYEGSKGLSIDALGNIVFIIRMMPEEKIQTFLTKISQGDISNLCELDMKKVDKSLKDISHEEIKVKFGKSSYKNVVGKAANHAIQAIEVKDGQIGGAGARYPHRLPDREWLQGEGRREMQAIVRRMPEFRENENNEEWQERAFVLVCEIYLVLGGSGMAAIFGSMFGGEMAVISGLGAGAYLAYQLVTGQL